MQLIIYGSLALLYLSGVTATFEITLDPADKFNVSWTASDDSIEFTMTAQTGGWIGLGLSPNGGMANADIIIGWVSDGQTYLEDRHAKSNSLPEKDEQQDVELLSGSEENGITTITFKRKLNTCDGSSDRPILSDTTRLIYAYGETDPVDNQLTSSDYHDQTRGSKSVYLLDPPTPVVSTSESVQSHEFISDVTVPNTDTTYYCTFLHAPNVTKKHHIISFEPVITPGNEGIVHHIIVYGCYNVDKMHLSNSNKTEGVCETAEMPEFYESCRAPIFTWAIGGTKFYFPENAGFAIGEESAPDFYMMETHYDNPSLLQGKRDFSGIRVEYTPELRQDDIGIIQVGSVFGIFVPPEVKDYNYHGYCTDTCTQNWIPEEGVNVFGYILHSHLLGNAIHVGLYRDGKELAPYAKDDHYDFNYQENRLFKEAKKLYKGDTLKVTCNYNAEDRTGVTYGGLASKDEMCLAFFMYYPRQNISSCETAPSYMFDPQHSLWSTLGVQHSVQGFLDTSYLDSVSWNEEKKAAAQLIANETDHIVFCTLPGVVEHEGNGDLFSNPEYEPYQEVLNTECTESTTTLATTTKGDGSTEQTTDDPESSSPACLSSLIVLSITSMIYHILL